MRTNCPDCDGTVHQIRLIDKGHGDTHKEWEYTYPDAKKGKFLGRYPVEGQIKAFMCQWCGRVVLYARRQEEESP